MRIHHSIYRSLEKARCPARIEPSLNQKSHVGAGIQTHLARTERHCSTACATTVALSSRWVRPSCNRQYFASNTNQLFYLISFNSTISKIFFYSSLVFWKFKTNFLESWPLKGFSSIAGSLNSSTMLISLQLHKVDHLIDGSSVQIEFWSIVHIKQVLTWFKLKKCSFYKIVSVSER